MQKNRAKSPQSHPKATSKPGRSPREAFGQGRTEDRTRARLRSLQRAGLVVQGRPPDQVFVLGVRIGDLGRKEVKLRQVELDDRTDAVVKTRLGEFIGLFGILQELGGDAQPI